jgi:hypothetical protein
MLTKPLLRTVVAILPLALLTLAPSFTIAQTITSGDIAGTVTDPSGAVLPEVKVILKSAGTGATQNAATNAQGAYRFSFLEPGRYELTINATGFQETRRTLEVQIGQTVTVNIQVAIAAATQTVDVTEAPVTVQTENGDIATTFTTLQVAEMPNPGNDVTYIAQTAPGVLQNTGGGYGNFSTFGLPGTANLFTTNGQNTMDPYLNLNYSGATNLLLGTNEVAEASVVNNGYSGQYGQMAGSQVNTVTKSGTNQFHANATWNWSGSSLAANDFFANQAGTAKTFYNDNQWADSVGGPIWKQKTFFYFNNEGLRVVLPAAAALIRIPSPQFESATLANLAATGQTAAVAFYQKAFNLYNNASGNKNGSAVPVAGGGCGTFTQLGAGVPCALQFRQNSTNFTHERIWSLRIDQILGKNDRLYGRYYDDNGLQATGTDAINPIFNAYSPQPAHTGQLSETHTFGSRAVNQFVFSAAHYSAIFSQLDYKAAVNTFPTQLTFTGTTFTTLAPLAATPQGRVVQQYQAADDLSLEWGKHAIKTGFNFQRYPFTDIGYQTGLVGTITVGNLQDFYAGGGVRNNLVQPFATKPQADFAYNSFGGYVQDEWKVRPNLKVNMAFRIDHTGNMSCSQNCFARLAAPFPALPHNVNIPYNQAILTGLGSAYQSSDAYVLEPRLGFAWQPKFLKGTVIRGGAGIFGDSVLLYAAGQLATLNPPNVATFRAINLPITPGVAGGLFAATAAANQAYSTGFANGATLAQLQASVPNFAVPRVITPESPIRQPRYYEWNLEVQQELAWGTLVSVNYVGNHGVKEFIRNGGLNAYCPVSSCGGFAGLPTSAPDPRFGRITEYQSSGISNFDGLVVSLRRRFSHGFLFNVNYTYGHALDELSNGGRLPFIANTNISETYPSNPFNIRGSMYGNADYDVRHNFTANYVWDNALRHMFKWGPNVLFSGWTVSGDVFHRTGFPFTVLDTDVSGVFQNYAGNVFAQVNGHPTGACGKSAVDTPCFSASAFTAPTGFSNQSRNALRGPNFTNTDLNITKKFRIKERVTLGIGASFYNLFNHPNFDQPVNDLANSQFGQIVSTVASPTSIFGAFVGSQAAPRIIQFKTQISF